jgi:hypothetical protein
MNAARYRPELSIVRRAREEAEGVLARIRPRLALAHEAIRYIQGQPVRRAVRGPSRLRPVPAPRHGRAPRRGRRRGPARRAASRGDPPEPAGRCRFALDEDPSCNRPSQSLAAGRGIRQAATFAISLAGDTEAGA